MALKVFIIEKFPIIREGIRALLLEHNEIEVVGTAATYEESRHLVAAAEILLIEHDHALEEALDRVYDIQELALHIKIILLSDKSEGVDFLNQMLTAGISGYITKNAGADELAYGIKKVSEDGLYICTAFILKFLQKLPELHQRFDPINSDVQLSTGEAEVLGLISEGLTNKEIANKLFLSVRTVESRRKRLFDKTNTTNTATLIKYCLKAGLIS